VGIFKIFAYVYSRILVITDFPSKGREARAAVQNMIPHKNGIIKVQSGGLILNSKTVVKRTPFAEVEC